MIYSVRGVYAGLFASVRAQLVEAKLKVTRISLDNEKQSHERRPGYHPDKQLEELRNLQVGV